MQCLFTCLFSQAKFDSPCFNHSYIHSTEKMGIPVQKVFSKCLFNYLARIDFINDKESC